MVGWGKILSVFHHRHLHPHPLGFLPPLPDAEGGSRGRDGEEWETEQEGGETEEEEWKGRKEVGGDPGGRREMGKGETG